MAPPESIPAQIEELKSLQSQLRFWRTLTIVAVLLIVVTCVGLISASVQQLVTAGPAQEEFVGSLVEGMNEDIVPELQIIASRAISDLSPVVQAELERLNERSPEFADLLRRELHLMTINLAAKSERIFDDHITEVVMSRRQWIEDNYPDVTREQAEQMAENLAIVAAERMEHVTTEIFAEQINLLNSITEHLQTIRDEELPGVQSEVPNWEMALMFLDLIRSELRPLESTATPVIQEAL